MTESKSDFTKFAQRVFQEEQLRAEIQKFQEEKNFLEQDNISLRKELTERNETIKQLERKLREMEEMRSKILLDRDVAIREREDMISMLRREVQTLRIQIEKEKSKSIKEFLSGKMKK